MRVKLGERWVGDGEPVYVIAEAGINHNGDMTIARRMIDTAAAAGADCVKLQKRDVEVVYGRDPYPESYLDQPREHPLGGEQTQRGQKQALEFTVEQHCELRDFANRRGLDYTVSCWDEGSLAEVVEHLKPPFIKVASPCLTDGPLMRSHGATRLPLVVSTGMATPDDVDDALYNVESAVIVAPSDCVLMHCVSSYPTDPADVNLCAINWLRNYNGTLVGYSGHELGTAITVGAVALGACVVERHLTLDRTMYGSDQAASLEPGEFKELVRQIREVEAALGDGVKRPRDSEQACMRKLRRVVP